MTAEITTLFVKMSNSLGSIDSKISALIDQINNHENRIQAVEKSLPASDLKHTLIKWLIIALLGTISVIVTLTGSGALLKGLLNL